MTKSEHVGRYMEVAAESLGPGFEQAVSAATNAIEKDGLKVVHSSAILTAADPIVTGGWNYNFWVYLRVSPV
jgi:hypothetical protein